GCDARGEGRKGPRAGVDRGWAASRRCAACERRTRPPELRLPGRAASDRARAPTGRGRFDRGSPRLPAAASARRRSLGARPGPPPRPGRTRAWARPDAGDGDANVLVAARACPGAARLAGTGAGRLMDRVGNDIARELRRFGPSSGLAPLVEAWPQAVG